MPIQPDIATALDALGDAHTALVAARAHLGGGDGESEDLPDVALQAVLVTDPHYLEAKAEVKVALETIREMVSPEAWMKILSLEQAMNLLAARAVKVAWRLGRQAG